MKVLTKKREKKNKRNQDIKDAYELAMKNGSQKYAVYEVLANKYDISETQIGRIVGNIK